MQIQPPSRRMYRSSPARRPFLATLLTIPVIFEPAIRYAEATLLCDIIGINSEGELVIYNLPAALTNQVDMHGRVCFIAVLHFIKFQHFDDAMLRKFAQDRVDTRQKTDLDFLLSSLLRGK